MAAVDGDPRDAAVRQRHDRLPRTELAELADADDPVLLVVELVAHELLGLRDVRRDDVGQRLRRPTASIA